MEAGRQLIRYVLPGGLAALTAVVFEVLYSWAWNANLLHAVEVVKDDPLTAAGGAVILGFVLYQLYYAFYRPIILIRIPLPIIDRLVYPIKTSDAGGAILRHLSDDPLAVAAITKVCRLRFGFEEWEWKPKLRSVGERDEYVAALTERAKAVRSLVNLTYNAGAAQIRRSYGELDDIYHALGACRAALVATSFAAGLVVGVQHHHQFANHLGASLAATAFAAFLFCGSWYTIQVNRRDTWRTMTTQLGTDLRIWALQNRPLLEQLAGTSPQWLALDDAARERHRLRRRRRPTRAQ
jgi:hypothetical protein